MSSLHDLVSGDPTRGISAVLGPTNTGKTHLALERMLRHRSGMIGLPLRLLAREVYDKLVARTGEGSVALITGEEKRVPPRARFFVCTVEAMPVDKHVAFVAVDEIQLAAHRTRGHVFTERLLHARGAVETMFLGSATARGIVERLVPTAELLGQPRLSRLRHAGHHRLKRLPPRSAVVAFSTARVYELAEQLRRQHGGTAVVLGALSPRTRNAQVALYQGGDVPILVATDAIGMGLNLDVDHVAFAATSKFDGRSRRQLHDDELAQIAGRAGRFLSDGTFGTTADAEALSDETIEAIEEHRFSPIKRVWWRNPDLDFSSLDDLLDSLEVPPRSRVLKRMPDADDHLALDALSRDEGVRRRALGSEERLRMLWEVAGIPDYRKRLTGAHAELLSEIYAQLCDHGVLPSGWVEARLRHLDRTEGDIGALMTRIAHVRTWTFISHKDAWVDGPGVLQARTRALEDRLSDALHLRLTARFVDHRVGITLDGERVPSAAEVDEDGAVLLDGARIASLAGLGVEGELPPRRTPSGRVVHEVVTEALRARALELVAAEDEDLGLGEGTVLCWRGHPVARWTAGTAWTRPAVSPMGLTHLGEAHRAAVRVRLERWTEARLARLTAPLRHRAREGLSADGQAFVDEIEEALGIGRSIDPRQIPERDRSALARLGLRLGRHATYLVDALAPDDLAVRARLWTAWSGRAPALPPPGATSVEPGKDGAFWQAAGWPVIGPLAVRIDVLEKVAARLRRAGRRDAFGLPDEVLSWLGASTADAAGVVRGLGYRGLQVAGEWRFVGSGRRLAGRR